MKRSINELQQEFMKQYNTGDIKSENRPTGNVYVHKSGVEIPATTPQETLEMFEKLVLDANTTPTISLLNPTLLPLLSIYVGQPDTGKSYKAMHTIGALFKPERVIITTGDEDNTIESLFGDFTVEKGDYKFIPTPTFNMLTDPNKEPALIVVDEANLNRPSYQKALQVYLTKTTTHITHKGIEKDAQGNEHVVIKTWELNPNVRWIFTMNDKDKGVNVLPNAILSRASVEYFRPTDDKTLAQWTGQSVKFIEDMRKIYQSLKIVDIFGSRQINVLTGMSLDQIISHLTGILALRGTSTALIETTEVKRLINSLIVNGGATANAN